MIIYLVYQLCKLNFDYFILQLETTKSDVVGCHIGLSSSSTSRNQSHILFDCCVNAILPLLTIMVSFIANMVVLRRVCLVPTLRQRMILSASYPPSIAKQHHKPQLYTSLNGLFIVVLPHALKMVPSIPE